MKTRIRLACALALVSAIALSSCRKERPSLTIHLKAVVPGGEPLAGVAVEAQGKPQGATDAEGQLSFSLAGDVGEEFPVSAHLDPPTTTSQGNRVAIFGRGPSRLQRLLGR